MTQKIKIQFYYRPDAELSHGDSAALVEELRSVGRACFDTLPDYQCFTGPEGLKDKVIAIARNAEGKVLGFSSALLVNVSGLRHPVLHLGLTCIAPEARGLRLTHKLASKIALGFLLKTNPFGRVWVSNVACVLSSIGNVALSFDQVYPSPFQAIPTNIHRQIARSISTEYRSPIYISEEAYFDEEAFVFRGSVGGTCFQKDEEDVRFHHRVNELNTYYRQLLYFEDGDEVCQVGNYSLTTLIRYAFKSALGRTTIVPKLPPPVAKQLPVRKAA